MENVIFHVKLLSPTFSQLTDAETKNIFFVTSSSLIDLKRDYEQLIIMNVRTYTYKKKTKNLNYLIPLAKNNQSSCASWKTGKSWKFKSLVSRPGQVLEKSKFCKCPGKVL